jgi:hypothetical protein
MSKGGGVNIPSDYTVKLGSDGSTIHIDSDLDNIHLKEIAPVTINSNLAVTQPIVTQSTSKSDSTSKNDSTVDLKMEPLKVSSDSTSAIDVKPLAIDSCQTLKLAPLPPIHVEQPYSQHFGITFMGMEVWGFNISGKSGTFLHSPAKAQHYVARAGESCECCGEAEHKPQAAPAQPRSGLRVRVK